MAKRQGSLYAWAVDFTHQDFNITVIVRSKQWRSNAFVASQALAHVKTLAVCEDAKAVKIEITPLNEQSV